MITPPRSHPAGPPPAAVDTENTVSSDSGVASRDDTQDDEEEETTNEYGGSTKDKSKKKNKKKKKKNRPEIWARQAQEAERRRQEEAEREASEANDVEVEYIQEELELDPMDRTFSKIFASFKIVDPAEAKAMQEEEEARKHAEQYKKVPKLLEDDDMIEETETDEPKMSKRKLKKLNRLSVAE